MVESESALREFCSECLIECARVPECWLISTTKPKVRLCQCCFALYRAICELPNFITAHQEWLKDEHKKNKLRPGADYFG